MAIPYCFNPVGLSSRPYKRALTYLEGTGTQWIDTGIVPDETIATHYYGQATVSAVAPQNSISFGEIEDNNRYGFSYSKTGCVLQFAGYLVVPSWTVDDDQQFSVDLVPVSGGMRFDFYNLSTQQSGTETRTGTISPTTTCMLFGVNQAPRPTRIYSFSMSKNNVLLIDLIPVLDHSSVACMYDRVSTQLFYNQGTGQFLYA